MPSRRTTLLALGLALAAQGPSRAAAQRYIPGTFQLTQYWIARELPRADEQRSVALTTRSGHHLAWTCPRFQSCLCMEGTGRLWDGRLLNWDARVGRRACFVEVDTGIYPFGVGTHGYALVPYRSLAVDTRFVPLGHAVELPELAGVPLPDGSRHDGCFVSVDGGGAIQGHHLDLFLPSEATWRSLSASRWIPSRVHAVIDSPRCAYALRYATQPSPRHPSADPGALQE